MDITFEVKAPKARREVALGKRKRSPGTRREKKTQALKARRRRFFPCAPTALEQLFCVRFPGVPLRSTARLWSKRAFGALKEKTFSTMGENCSETAFFPKQPAYFTDSGFV